MKKLIIIILVLAAVFLIDREKKCHGEIVFSADFSDGNISDWHQLLGEWDAKNGYLVCNTGYTKTEIQKPLSISSNSFSIEYRVRIPVLDCRGPQLGLKTNSDPVNDPIDNREISFGIDYCVNWGVPSGIYGHVKGFEFYYDCWAGDTLWHSLKIIINKGYFTIYLDDNIIDKDVKYGDENDMFDISYICFPGWQHSTPGVEYDDITISLNTTTSTTTTTTTTSSTTTTSTSTTTTTLASTPIVTTGQAEAYTESATLNGTINPNGSMSYHYFEYGTTSGYGYDTPLKIIGSGTTEIPVSAYIEGLRKNTLYHCRLVAYNGVGMTEGQDIVFNTIIDEINNSKAIIVAGGGPYAENNIWEEVEEVAACAYRALLTQGYSKDIVYYLSPNTLHDVDGDDHPDVDAEATGVNLEYAIKSWPQDVSQLVIFLVGHGGKQRFKIGEKTEITAQVLDGWLDDTQNGMIQQAVFVYDACYSGSFLPLFSPPAGKERIVATSSSSDQNALISADGKLSFSYLFWTSIRNGDSFYDSFVFTKNAISIAYPGKQSAQIEGNGNGIGDEKEDKSVAGQVRVGLELKSGSDLPVIGSVSSLPQTVSIGSSAVIFAENVSALEGVNNVWAVITPPGYSSAPNTPVTDLPILDLSFGNGRYEGTYGGFVTPGVYNIAVFAEDDKGFVSVPAKTTVTATGNADPTCLSVSGGLGIQVPCAEYNGKPYGFTLDFYHNPDDMSGYYWKMVMSTLTTGTGSDCIPISGDLSMAMDCVSYNGTQYGFTLDFYSNPYDPSGYYWKMDKSTLVVK